METTKLAAVAASTEKQDEKPPVAPRDSSGKWLKGASGNPKGGPRGITRSEAIRVLLEPHKEELIGSLLELTKHIDPHARVRAIVSALEYIAPRPKPDPERIVVPGLSDAITLHDKAGAIVGAVASGQISPEAGRSVLQMLETVARVAKIEDIERRIDALEGRTVRTVEGEST